MTGFKMPQGIGILSLVALALAFIFAVMSIDIGSILLVIIGLAIGFMTITAKERVWYIITAIAFAVMSVSVFAVFGDIGTILSNFFRNVILIVVPFAFIAAIMQWYDMAKGK